MFVTATGTKQRKIECPHCGGASIIALEDGKAERE